MISVGSIDDSTEETEASGDSPNDPVSKRGLQLSAYLAEYRELENDKRQYFRLATTVLGFVFAGAALLISVLRDDLLPGAVVVMMVSVGTLVIAGYRSFIDMTAIQAARVEAKVNRLVGTEALTWETRRLRAGGIAGPEGGIPLVWLFIIGFGSAILLAGPGLYAFVSSAALKNLPPILLLVVQSFYLVLDVVLLGTSVLVWRTTTGHIVEWKKLDTDARNKSHVSEHESGVSAPVDRRIPADDGPNGQSPSDDLLRRTSTTEPPP